MGWLRGEGGNRCHLRTGKKQDMVLRNARGQFCKGESGNPGGRRPDGITITALIDEAVSVDDWEFIIKKLVRMARRGNLKAIEMLMDRRFGKALQVNELTGKDAGALIVKVVYES